MPSRDVPDPQLEVERPVAGRVARDGLEGQHSAQDGDLRTGDRHSDGRDGLGNREDGQAAVVAVLGGELQLGAVGHGSEIL